MDANQLLNEFGLTMGLPNLRLDEYGCARLMFDGATAVDLEMDNDTGLLQLYSVLSPVPAEGREAMFRSLLEGNLFGAQTHGATLAIDALYNEILLCRTINAKAVSGAEFASLMERFVDSVEIWKERIENLPEMQDAAPRGDQYVTSVSQFTRG